MRLARIILAILIGLGFAAATRAFVIIPLHCLLVVKRTEDRTREAIAARPGFREVLARENIRALRRCEGRYSPDIHLYMLLGANHQLAEEWEQAAAAYESALRIDRRPEIYINIGMTRLHLNQEVAAIDAFVTACAFAPQMLDEVPEGDVRDRVVKEIGRRYGPKWLR